MRKLGPPAHHVRAAGREQVGPIPARRPTWLRSSSAARSLQRRSARADRAKRADEPAKITAKHILVKHKGSKRAPGTIVGGARD